MARFTRYTLSQQKEDLDKGIVQAIILLPVSRAGLSLNVVQLLFRLAFALLHRSEKFEQPEDVKSSIEHLRYLRGLPIDSFDLSTFPETPLQHRLSGHWLFNLSRKLRIGHGVSKRWWSSAANSLPPTYRQPFLSPLLYA